MTEAERAANLAALLNHPGFIELESMAKDRAFTTFAQSDNIENMQKTVEEWRATQRLRRLAENYVADISAKG